MNYKSTLYSLALVAALSGCAGKAESPEVPLHNDSRETYPRETVTSIMDWSVKIETSAKATATSETGEEMALTQKKSGSGLALQRNYVLTVSHNLPPAIGTYEKINVVESTIEVEGHPASVFKRDEKKDLALLVLQDCPKENCLKPYVGKIVSELEPGDIIVGAGYSLGEREQLFKGYVTGDLYMEQGHVFLAATAVIFGDSGSPALAFQQGKPLIAGLLRGIQVVAEEGIGTLNTGRAYITPPRDIAEFLKEVKGLESYQP